VVAVEALVIAGDLAEVGGRAAGGDGSFADARHGRSVVAEVFQRGISHRVAVRHDVQLR
jgi:hypothetical protein